MAAEDCRHSFPGGRHDGAESILAVVWLRGALVLAMGGVGTAGAEVKAAPLISGCGTTPPARECVVRWMCLNGSWEPPKANGTACSDDNACTQSDTCQAGVCTRASSVVCIAADQCHAALPRSNWPSPAPHSNKYHAT
jgi:hypothetical protein